MTKQRKKATVKPAAKPTGGTGDPLTSLIEQNYSSLRTIARREIVQRKLQRTTTPTSLVAETVMRLMRQRKAPQSSTQLCGLAAIMMTRALADRTRRAGARKRGSARKALLIDDGIERDLRTERGRAARRPRQDSLQTRVLSCLESMSREHPRETELITLHLVLGIPVEKAAALMGISRRTAYRALETGLVTLRSAVGIDALEDAGDDRPGGTFGARE